MNRVEMYRNQIQEMLKDIKNETFLRRIYISIREYVKEEEYNKYGSDASSEEKI